jgi:hypothetical protein
VKGLFVSHLDFRFTEYLTENAPKTTTPLVVTPAKATHKRGSRDAFEVLARDARFRGRDEKSPITCANFCNEKLPQPDHDSVRTKRQVPVGAWIPAHGFAA